MERILDRYERSSSVDGQKAPDLQSPVCIINKFLNIYTYFYYIVGLIWMHEIGTILCLHCGCSLYGSFRSK